MRRILIKEDYLKKIKLLNKYNKFYFDDNSPTISDYEYDKLKKEIIQIEQKYPELVNEDSVSQKVGYKPSKNFKKVNHKVPMLSLSNAFDVEDLKNFEKKIINFLSLTKNTELEYSTEPKIDGISASLKYEKGILKMGLSRGDGKEGEDITENLKTITDIPKRITLKDFPKEIDIRGEVYISKNDFKNMEKNFANPRNAASGSLRQKNPEETKKIPLHFVAYTFGFIDKNIFNYQSEFLDALNKWGFQTSKYNKVIKDISDLMSFHKKFENERFQLDYDVDGLVYKVDEFELQKRLGFTSNAPRWAIAHKFSSNKAFSEILNIEIQIGRTGALTPVAKIKPVNIGGVIVSNATLHNEDEINRKDIRIGDTVKIERAGDVIPHVVEVDLKKRKNYSKKFIFPAKCPSCGSNTEKEFNKLTKKFDAVRRCTNEGYVCEKIAIEKIKHFISKEALNIDGLGKKVVEKFWELKIISSPQDIFNLDYKKISNLDGWGEKSVANLKFSINQSKKISLDKFIYSIGIRHIGVENAKLVADYCKTINFFLDIIKKKQINVFLNIDGIGETQINSLKKFFTNKFNYNIVKELSIILSIEKIKFNEKGKLKNKNFMFTGKLTNMSRAEAKSLVEQNSGSIISSVNKRLNFLVIGEKPTNKKIEQAKKIGIKVLSQNDWIKLLD